VVSLLQLDIEQRSFSDNYVTLSDEIDSYGRSRAKVNWSIDDHDFKMIRHLAERLLSRWKDLGDDLPRLIPLDIAQEVNKPYDAYHPVGTCRMGDGDSAVVDLDLKVINSENLWLVSTGVLPTAGTANPTLTMLCLAQDLADRLRK
jgi:choline dehydrogenase-like flavoprotein